MRSQSRKINQRGQVIVAAVAIMFLLAFVAGLFLALISRNLGRTQRGSDVLQAQYLAEAGIRFADQMLTHSPQGADWRPEPQAASHPDDPDYEYIQAGYTRFNQGNGRYLLRVSYQPVTLGDDGRPVDASGQPTEDPAQMLYPAMGRYLRIESIGRRGVVDPNDPTTWRGNDPLRRMLVAFKPIGITDYVRFVTNKDRSNNTMVLGSEPFLRDNDEFYRTLWNGPIRVNGDLMWSGFNAIRLNSAERIGSDLADYYTLDLNPLDLASANLFPVNRDDTVDVAGRIYHDPLPASAPTGNQVRLLNPKAPTADQDVSLEPTVDLSGAENPGFLTAGGVYRDSAMAGSSAGRARGVTRLEPPRMDEDDPSTGILRYRLLTRNSGSVPAGRSYNIGQNGLGQGIYINNNREIQRETALRRLPDEWARTGTGLESEATPQGAWRQHLYTPPGTEIYLDPTPSPDLNTNITNEKLSQGTIIITRHDGNAWQNEDNQDEGYTRRYRYPLRRAYDVDGNLVDSEVYDEADPVDPLRDRSGAYKTFQNGVIFAEGNVRIQGKLPADWRASNDRIIGQNLTIVTNGVAYIEGNLLKGDPVISAPTPYGTGVQMGGIAILARQYVTVNPTAYFMKQPDTPMWSFALGNPFTELAAAGQQYTTSAFSAVNPSRYPNDARDARQTLMLLQTAETFPGAAAELMMYSHRGGPTFGEGTLFWNNDGPVPMTVTPGQSVDAPAENIWQHRSIPIYPRANAAPWETSWQSRGRPAPDWFQLTYRPYFGPSPYSANTGGAEYMQNYNQPLWLSRVALAPMDIRIEAVLYAQEGSFFVIPGEWLNANPADQRDRTSLVNSLRRTNPAEAGWRYEDGPNNSTWPFYAEPPDVRVVVNGAVAENVPAATEFQTLWAKRWGWTPVTRPDGSEGAHNGEGLTYLYDQRLRVPLRYDRYGRPLPPMPALPVSPDLVFFGEAG